MNPSALNSNGLMGIPGKWCILPGTSLWSCSNSGFRAPSITSPACGKFFVFVVLTVLGIPTLQNCAPQISGTVRSRWLLKKQPTPYIISLNKYSRAILEKYADFHFLNDLALPVVSNARMNEHLKLPGEMVVLTDYKAMKPYIKNGWLVWIWVNYFIYEIFGSFNIYCTFVPGWSGVFWLLWSPLSASFGESVF